MLSIDPYDMQSPEAIYGLVAFFIANVIINLFLINKYLEEKRKNRILNKSIPTPESNIVAFLTSQFDKTKTHNRSPANLNHQLHKEVVHLRSAYLKIEEKAVTKKIDSIQYWQYLDENLFKLVKIIFPQAANKNNEITELESKIALLKERITKIPNNNGNEKVDQHKARAIASLEQIGTQHKTKGYDRTIFQKQLNKLESIVDIFEDPEARKNYLIDKKRKQYLKNSEEHVDQLDQLSQRSSENILNFEKLMVTPNKLSEELAHFKTENDSLSKQIDQLKSELTSFRSRTFTTDPVESFTDDNTRGSHPYEISDITDELIESNEKEIDHLRDVIANQRHSIFEMEESLNTLEQLSKNESSGHQSEIDKLKRCIQESEVCITMLEKELDELKEDLIELRNSRSGGDLSVTESEALSDEVKQLKSEIEQSNHQLSALEQLSNYASRAVSAESIEDLSLLVYETIVSLNYSPQLLIKSPDRTIELSPQGSVSVRDKVMINNMQINEADPSGGQLNFRFMQIAGMVSSPSESSLSENDQQLIIKILKLTDKILVLLTHAQRSKQYAKIRDDTINAIKHVSYDLDQLIDEHSKKSKKVVVRNFQQISDIARAKGMSATQVAAIHSIEQETIRQVETANALRLKSRKDFLKLIKVIEDTS